MSTVIPADDLEVGDVYRSRGSLRVLEADAYVVISIRTVKTVETYQVVEAINLRTGLRASINLRTDVEVVKLDPFTHGDVEDQLGELAEDETLVVVRYDGRFWA